MELDSIGRFGRIICWTLLLLLLLGGQWLRVDGQRFARDEEEVDIGRNYIFVEEDDVSNNYITIEEEDEIQRDSNSSLITKFKHFKFGSLFGFGHHGNHTNGTAVSTLGAIGGALAKKAAAFFKKVVAFFKDLWKKFLKWFKKTEKVVIKWLLWMWKHKPYICMGVAGGVALLFLICCCCCCRKCCCKGGKKKKKDEKIKLKGAKPKKKLKRIQPTKVERQVMEDLGSLNFSLSYDKDSEMLLVKVIESEDIPVHDLSGYAYSFVVAKLLPLHRDETTEYKTALVRVSFRPAFGDVLSFVVEKDDIDDQILYLYQFELNRWSKHDGIGQVVFPLKTAKLKDPKTGEVEMKKKLLPYDPLIGLEVESGAVFMVMEYNPESWELTVEIRQADIIPQDDEEKRSSYVTLSLLNEDEEVIEKRKTGKVKGTLQPTYGKEVTFNIPDSMLHDTRLLLKLKKPRIFKKPGILGKSIILPTSDHWKQLIEKEFTSGWFPVYIKPKDKD